MHNIIILVFFLTSFAAIGQTTNKFTILTAEQVTNLVNSSISASTNFSASSEYIFNVKKYGAKGDGVSDDSYAILSAWIALTNSGHGQLYFPSGKYPVTNTYILGNTLSIFDPGYQGSAYSIVGDGAGASIWIGNITNGIFINTIGGQSINFKDITIRGAGSGTNIGFRSDTTGNMYINNAAFDNWTGVGCDVAMLAGGNIIGGEFSRCGIGLLISGYADGWNISAGIHKNLVGVMVGGIVTNAAASGTIRANGAKIYVSGHYNKYGVIVSANSSGTYISGYLEATTNALVCVGAPPDFLVNGETYIGPVTVENLSGVQHSGITLSSTIKVYATNVIHLTVRGQQNISGTAVELMNNLAKTNSAIEISGSREPKIKFYDGTFVNTIDPGNNNLASTKLTWNILSENYTFRDWTNSTFSVLPWGYIKILDRMFAKPFAADSVPQTMLYSYIPTVNSATLFIGGGTGAGKPYKDIKFYAGTPSVTGAGSFSGMIDANGFTGNAWYLTNLNTAFSTNLGYATAIDMDKGLARYDVASTPINVAGFTSLSDTHAKEVTMIYKNIYAGDVTITFPASARVINVSTPGLTTCVITNNCLAEVEVLIVPGITTNIHFTPFSN